MAFKKDSKIKSNFTKITIGLASPEEILESSYGEVTKPETINYRTYKPERDGLFCERIFGPTKDYECACGKYKRIRYKGIVCDRCGVEVTEKKVRRERTGHIELVVPVAHIWYFRSLPNKISYLLGIPTKKLDSVIYYEKYIVIQPGVMEGRTDSEGVEINGSHKMDFLTEDEYVNIMDNLPDGNEYLEDTDPNKFIAKMGAEAIYDLLVNIDLDALSYELRDRANSDSSQQRKTEALKRLQVVEAFRSSRNINKPEWMIMKIIPVTPPELRPLVPLDGGRFATSDLNDLYRRVIIRNNRLKRLMEIKAPEVILRNEKRMLQEAVDSLFDNSRKSSAVKSDSNRPLKSLSDSLKGKQGRFRQNLLGKRVDYSARSVIVVGPELKMGECGLPKLMAAELYKPFIIRKLIERGIVKTVKSAKKIVDRREPVIWDILENVMKGHPVLLNRAPTLHRLGIQAFQPKLIEGKAIQLHPLACTAFNADFDGDQMAVHLPLSAEAQAEARSLMMASDNILKPADGHTVTMPSQDMILGLYYLSTVLEGVKGQGRVFSSLEEAEMALDRHEIDMQAKVLIRLPESFVLPKNWEPGEVKVLDPREGEDEVVKEERFHDGTVLFATSYGRILFNETLPTDYPFVNEQVAKGRLSKIVDDIAMRYSTQQVAATLDALKDLGFTRAPWSGVSFAFSDVNEPPERDEKIAEYEAKADKVNANYEMGLLTEEARRQELIDLWTECTAEVSKEVEEKFDPTSNLAIIVQSGARGNMMQINQIAGMRGLVANPKGEIIPRPVKSNYRDGLSVLEYFISQHGARKGLADTALRTAESGYLTRRLVDVSQDVIVREEDCGTKAGLPIRVAERDNDGNLVLVKAADGGPYSRLLAADVIDPADGQTVLYKRDDALSMDVLNDLVAHGVEEVKCRSVLTCESKRGVCAKCYGWSLATNKLVDVGETVGIVAAQSIGEPGTQLTLRSFHSGGVAAASDITQGLPRVTELFEARTPKGEAPITEFAGSIKIVENDRGRQIILTPDADSGAPKEDGVIKPITYQVSKRVPLKVADGDHIKVGTQLVEGSVDPKKILTILGKRAAQVNIVEEVHTVYRSQGVDIHDKHIEVIVHQMTRRVTIIDSGDTDLLPGELVDNARFREINRNIVKNGGRPAVGRPALMGITKASLATDSWLSAASFQETTRVLTEAALSEKVDDLKGLKENVIIGKLIPAGTGLARYRNAVVEPDKAIRDTIYPNFGLGGDGDLGDASFSDADLSDLNFSNLEFGDLKLGDDFNPDDFYSDQGGQPDIEE